MKPLPRRQVKDLKYGDIIRIVSPYKENLNSTFHGYKRKDVVGDLYRDKKGYTGKDRPVMVLGAGEGMLHYMVLTSKAASLYDNKFQYELSDNSMLSLTKQQHGISTFVETRTAITISAKEGLYVKYIGHLNELDKTSIKEKAFNHALRDDYQLNINGRYKFPRNDQTYYIDNKFKEVVDHLKTFDYEQVDYYHKDIIKCVNKHDKNRQCYLYRSGIMKYRHVMTLDQARYYYKKSQERQYGKLEVKPIKEDELTL